ncbi:MAG: GMC family oxidoreductase [Bacteroidetes Order II. Incertae sedis bacterium]|nr:GMC family oxidoreductase [Bacteroidetes Order II. bacterium]
MFQKPNIYVSTQTEYDAIVVGSGITGGWAAKELTEKGLNVLMLERGNYLEHKKDYVTEHKSPWEFPFRGRGERKKFEEEYEVQSTCYAFYEGTEHMFVNDKDHPYIQNPEKPFWWIRGYHLGGRSLMWGRQCYRWGEQDFEANAKDGYGVDWPIRYRDIAPWYDYVERFVGISGEALGLPHVPDGIFQKPMEMNAVEKHVKAGIEKNFTDRKMTIGRCANLTEPIGERTPCHYCGPCERGCSTGSSFSSQSSTLPAAFKTGRLAIRANSIVHSVLFDEQKGRAYGVQVIDALSKETRIYKAKVIFLCASTIGSTAILLNSTSRTFPNGLANGSGTLGHYLMDHHFQLGAGAKFPEFNDRYYTGKRPNGIYIPRFRNLNGEQRPDFVRGYGYQGGAGRASWKRGNDLEEFGFALKTKLREPGDWGFSLMGFGETLPLYENRIWLDPEKNDQWGIPMLHIEADWSDNERKMRQDMLAAAAEMIEAAGGKEVYTFDNGSIPGHGIHEMGTARMGKDPKTSVLNGWNQAHEVPNLFVTDGAAMASSACQNPSITYMALTARACHYVVEKMKRNEL